jgi:hypothetical protein
MTCRGQVTGWTGMFYEQVLGEPVIDKSQVSSKLMEALR